MDEFQRIAVYAVIQNQDQILLSQLDPNLTNQVEVWTLPGGGLEFGEEPISGLQREIYEETGLTAEVKTWANTSAAVREVEAGRLMHSIRIVYDAEVATDVTPVVVEENGSTVAAKWWPLAAIKSGELIVSAVVKNGLEVRGLLDG